MALLWAIRIVSGAAALGVVAAVVAMLKKRLLLAVSLARVSTVVALVVLAVPVLAVLLTVVAPQAMMGVFRSVLPLQTTDPSQTARILAQGISELLNSVVLGVPVVAIGGVLWTVATRRIAKAASP